MIRILLVDDRLEELEALQGLLNQANGNWQVDWAESGTQALQKMCRTRFDVVVSDFLMPKMDGEQLLKKIKQQYPQTVRILLSGAFDWKAIPRLMTVAHQYLWKPCEPAELRATIARALFLRDLLANESLLRVVAQMAPLPGMPPLYLQLTKELHRPKPSPWQLGEIISQDADMCSKLISLVNTPFFELAQPFCDPADAVLYLGPETVKALVLALQVFSVFGPKPIDEFSVQRFWKHSWGSGKLAKQLSAAENLEAHLIDQSFLAGLLHDVGKLVLNMRLPEQFRTALRLHQQNNVPFAHAEQEIYGCTHAELGAYLLATWGLPNPVVEAVALHHRPADWCGSSFSVATSVHVANALEHEQSGAEFRVAQVNTQFLAKLGLSDHLAFWRERAADTLCERAA